MSVKNDAAGSTHPQLDGDLTNALVGTRRFFTRAEVSQDRKSVRLHVEGLQEGHVHDLNAAAVRSADGQPLLHPQAYYTLNYIPER